jgi:hypothetical protein
MTTFEALLEREVLRPVRQSLRVSLRAKSVAEALAACRQMVVTGAIDDAEWEDGDVAGDDEESQEPEVVEIEEIGPVAEEEPAADADVLAAMLRQFNPEQIIGAASALAKERARLA